MTAIPEFSFTYLLDPEPVQVGHARAQVRKILPGWDLAEHDDLLELIVSELVTNALHCKGPIQIRLSYDGNDLRIEISDNDDEMPSRRDPDRYDECGRGLQLIDGLIELHGGTRGSAKQTSCPGKVVYVVLPLRSGQQIRKQRAALRRRNEQQGPDLAGQSANQPDMIYCATAESAACPPRTEDLSKTDANARFGQPRHRRSAAPAPGLPAASH